MVSDHLLRRTVSPDEVMSSKPSSAFVIMIASGRQGRNWNADLILTHLFSFLLSVHHASVVDLCVFHWLDGVQYQLPEEYRKLPIPTLRTFKESIAARPRIEERLKTRKEKYDGTGPIF